MPPFEPVAGMPVAGAGAPAGQPPFGPSPLTMPVPHRGQQAAGLALVRNAVEILTKALPQLGAETDPGQAVMKAIQSLAKHVPPGSTTPGAENASMQQFMMQRRQMAPLLAALAAHAQGGGAGAPPAPPPMPPQA